MSSSHSRLGIFFGLISLALLGLATLIFFEILRPFRDGGIDLPMAVAFVIGSAAFSSAAITFGKGAAVLNWIALIVSMLALFGVALLFQALSHMKLM